MVGTELKKRDPELRYYFPVWCHHHGSKMRVKSFNKEHHLLVIAGSAAFVRITRRDKTKQRWLVEWEVIQSQQEKVNGRIIMKKEELQSAFGLSDKSGKFGDWLIERYGADVAEQGTYIRWKNYLNIPCPGTGHDGDPNVSIHIDDEIKKAVQQLLE